MNPELLQVSKKQFQTLGNACLPSMWDSVEIHRAQAAFGEIVNIVSLDRLKWREHVICHPIFLPSQLDSVPGESFDEAVKKLYIFGDVAQHSYVLRKMMVDSRCPEIATAILGSSAICHFSNATVLEAHLDCSCPWHRDWPNRYCMTRAGHQLSILICLDSM